MISVNLEQAIFEDSGDYIVKTASTVDKASKILEVGFEYVTEMDCKKSLGSGNNDETYTFYKKLYRFMWYCSIASFAFSRFSRCSSRNMLSLSTKSFLHSPQSISPDLHPRSLSMSFSSSSSNK